MDSQSNETPNQKDSNIITEKVVHYDDCIEEIEYSKGQFLGKGGFAECYLFTRQDDS